MLKRGPIKGTNTIMGAIEDVYEDVDADVSVEEFREAVEEKVEQMGGLADEETAAMLVAHELDQGEVETVADVEPGMEEAAFVAKVTSIGELRTFERDGDADEGRVVNVELADETGRIRAAFWDERAQAVADGELETGDVLKVQGRPQEGYAGVEVSVDQAEIDDETEIEVHTRDAYRTEDLALGLSDVNLRGKVLATEPVWTFERDDGSEGRVANLVLGDETGRARVTLWDERADVAEEFEAGESVEVVDGYVRERDGDVELHVGGRGAVEAIDEDVEYVPDTTDVADVEIGETVDLSGVVRTADPKRTFDRDDGSEGQVRNVRVQDETGDIRVALWGEKADEDIGPGDLVQLGDVEIQDGWQDDLEASAGWRSTVTVIEEADRDAGGGGSSDGADAGLSDFGGGGGGSGTADDDDSSSGDAGDSPSADAGGDSGTEAVAGATDTEATDGDAGTGDAEAAETDGPVEFTGTVVQAGDPVVLDDGEETVSVETDADVHLGEEVTVRGERAGGRIDAEELF